MTYLTLSRIEKKFGSNHVVKGFDLTIDKGEFVSFLGPSGCGKTTVLRMVAGFETPSVGEIRIDGEDITQQKPSNRKIGMVFQSYALFPNLTVAQNIGFGLRIAGLAAPERDTRVEEMLQLIGLPELSSRYPFQLSGGQQQRVALARALAVRPRVLLLDEPLSALDRKIRVVLRDEIRAIQRRLGITTIFVTHDQEEALSISDRVVLMNDGVMQQYDAPHVVYNRPANSFVANFVGTLNKLDAVVVDPGKGVVRFDGVECKQPHDLSSLSSGRPITFAIRPESLQFGNGLAKQVTLPAVVEDVSFLGSVIRLSARVGQQQLSLDTFNRGSAPPPQMGTQAQISFSADDLLYFPVQSA